MAFVMAGACAAVACGDGVARPLVAVEEEPAEVTGGGGGAGAFIAGSAGAAANGGRGGTDAVPPSAHCDAVASWPAESESLENEVLEAVNGLRVVGLNCSGERRESPPELAMDASLRCAARLHARDMVERRFFDHVNPDGLDYPARIELTGYRATHYGESIMRGDSGFGSSGPWGPLGDLFDRADEECGNLADPRFDSVGVGHYDGVWTLDFGGG